MMSRTRIILRMFVPCKILLVMKEFLKILLLWWLY